MNHHFENQLKFEVNELKVTVETLSKSKSNFDRQTEKLEESITTLKGQGSYQPERNQSALICISPLSGVEWTHVCMASPPNCD